MVNYLVESVVTAMATESYNPWLTMSLRNYEEPPPQYRKQLNVTNDVSDILGAKPVSKSALFLNVSVDYPN